MNHRFTGKFELKYRRKCSEFHQLTQIRTYTFLLYLHLWGPGRGQQGHVFWLQGHEIIKKLLQGHDFCGKNEGHRSQLKITQGQKIL